MNSASLYRRIIIITEDYLGPAAKRFIDRQIENHLEKHPEAIVPEDLPQFIQWARLSFSALTDNNKIVKEYAERLEKLNENEYAET